MHPLIAHRGWYRLYLAGWLPLGGLVVFLLAATAGLPLGEALAVGLPLVAVFSQIALSAWYVCRVTPLRVVEAADLLRPALTLAVAAALSSALWLLLGWAWVATLELFPGLAGAADRYRGALPLLFALGVLLYLLVAAGHYLALAVETSRSAERRALEARVLAREAELKALRAQVDPHFLFNSLNAVAALAGGDPAAARRMALMLADFLRQSLRLVERDTIPLDEELALARAYLAIEQVRFGERLAVAERLDPAAGDAPVPPLLLQPLVENAVKHGIAGLVDGGRIEIATHLRGVFITVEVVNDRDPEGSGRGDRGVGAVGRGGRGGRGAGTDGIGLANVRRRLAARYGDEAHLRTTAEPGRFRVEVRLPRERESGARPPPPMGGRDGGRTPREREESGLPKAVREQQSEVDQRIGLSRPVAPGDLEGRIEKLDAEP
jgi:two-component system, LytTR family, sensor histidine kinase AlgZ